MAFAILLPALSLFLGMLLATPCAALKTPLAKLLSMLLIPAVIVYNMLYYQSGSIQFIAFSFCSSACLYLLYLGFASDKLRALCLAYPNLAWLGFPVAFAIFGDAVSAAMVALYIGGSLFGNLMALSALSPSTPSYWVLLQRVLRSPPVLALVIAALLRLLGAQDWPLHALLDPLYQLSKLATSFVGMFVLGLWLRHTVINGSSIHAALRLAGLRLVVGLLLCALAWRLLPFAHSHVYLALLLMIFLLPPGANIVSLETYYRGAGQSAQYIAAGTLISCLLLAIYALLLHAWLL